MIQKYLYEPVPAETVQTYVGMKYTQRFRKKVNLRDIMLDVLEGLKVHPEVALSGECLSFLARWVIYFKNRGDQL